MSDEAAVPGVPGSEPRKPEGYESFTPEEKQEWEEFLADWKPVPDDHPLQRPGVHLFFVKQPTRSTPPSSETPGLGAPRPAVSDLEYEDGER